MPRGQNPSMRYRARAAALREKGAQEAHGRAPKDAFKPTKSGTAAEKLIDAHMKERRSTKSGEEIHQRTIGAERRQKEAGRQRMLQGVVRSMAKDSAKLKKTDVTTPKKRLSKNVEDRRGPLAKTNEKVRGLLGKKPRGKFLP